MTAPSAAPSVPVVWDPLTTFQHSFEDDESLGLWDVYTGVTTSSTSGAADGAKYARLAGGKYLSKRLNDTGSYWLRFCFRLEEPVGTSRDILRIGSGDKEIAVLFYWDDEDAITCAYTPLSWQRSSTWQTIEYYVNWSDEVVYVYLEGSQVASYPIVTPDDHDNWLYFGSGTGTTVIDIDAVRIGYERPGLPGDIVATAPAYTRLGDVELDGVAFNILPGQYQEQDISGFAPRLGSGAPAYSDLSGFQHFLIPSLHHGIGQPHMTGSGEGDENRYLIGSAADTTGNGIIRPMNAVTTTAEWTTVPPVAAMTGGEIVSCAMGTTAVYGAKFAATQTSASYTCLFWRAGANTGSKAFTCTDGIRGLLYNGQYLFVTLGGTDVKMQKTANLTDWSDVGSATLPPVDMGAMAVHDEFLWVADRKEPIVYRAGQTDASDLAKETVLGLGAHRIGPGSVPINSMCSFEGKLYVGRQDGLYAVTQDADYVYVQPVETFPQSTYNCRSMVVYEGYLVYAIGKSVYRLGGTSTAGTGAKMDISPGPLSATYPYTEVLRWDGFSVGNGYLWAIGYDSAGYSRQYCYNGSGWHALAELSYSATQPGTPGSTLVSVSSTAEPLAHTIQYYTGPVAAHLTENVHSARIGAEAPVASSTYVTEAEVYTSWMHFGLPMVPKLFRLVRLDAESVSSTALVEVAYSLETGQGQVTGTLGTICQAESTFLMFPPGTLGVALQLHLTLRGAASDHVIIKKIVIQYMDRPQTVWGYQLTLDLSSPPRTTTTSSTGDTVGSLKEHLRRCREKASYVHFVDLEGNESDVFVSAGPRFMRVQDKSVAQLTLMVVRRDLLSAAVTGTPLMSISA